MSSPRRLLCLAAAACLIALTACGGDAEPDTNPSTTETAEGQLGEATATPSATTTTSSAPATTTARGGGGGGGGGTGGGGYPDEPGDYGLAMLSAIAANDDARIVDLSSLNTAQHINQQNYKSKNGQWSLANCDPGTNPHCYYYNQTGDFATVGVEAARLGQASAVSSVSIEGNSFATDAGGYVQDFVAAWIAGSYVKQRAHANDTVINAVSSLTLPQGGFVTQPSACGSNRLCVDAGEYLAGGVPAGQIIHFAVDQTRLGKPNAIVEASV
jgi:hypothetical protein